LKRPKGKQSIKKLNQAPSVQGVSR